MLARFVIATLAVFVAIATPGLILRLARNR